EAPQAAVDLVADRLRVEPAEDVAGLVPRRRALREHERPVGHVPQGPLDHGLRVAETVGPRGVDPVDAVLERAVDRADRVRVVLRAQALDPVAAADRPRPEADRRELEARVAELTVLHRLLPSLGGFGERTLSRRAALLVPRPRPQSRPYLPIRTLPASLPR